MSRSFELEVKPLRGYGFKTEILKKAILQSLHTRILKTLWTNLSSNEE